MSDPVQDEELNERKYIDITQVLCISNIVIYNKYKWIGGNKAEKCISSLFYKDRKKYIS